MVRAVFNERVIADSSETVVVENNHYFPADSVQQDCLQPSDHTTVCPWKGTAHYYHVVAGGQTAQNAAWYYPAPKEAAANIADRFAFWNGVVVS